MTPHCCPHQASCPLDLAAVCGQGPALSSNLAWVISMPYANGSPCNILNNFYPSPWPYRMLLLPVCFCIDQNWNHLQRTDSTLSTKTRKLSFTVLLNIQLSPPPNSNRNRDRLRSTSVRLQHQETIQSHSTCYKQIWVKRNFENTMTKLSPGADVSSFSLSPLEKFSPGLRDL